MSVRSCARLCACAYNVQANTNCCEINLQPSAERSIQNHHGNLKLSEQSEAMPRVAASVRDDRCP